MSAYIELINTVTPKNGQDYPIVFANDIKGGYHTVGSYEEMEAISEKRRMAGMLCYVIGGSLYQLSDDLKTWNLYEGSGATSNGIYIGSTPPPQEATDIKIWIDTSDDIENPQIEDSVLKELIATIKAQQTFIEELRSQVKQLTSRITVLENGYTPPTAEEFTNAFFLENGEPLLLEDGSYLVLEEMVIQEEVENAVLLENGEPLLMENGNYLKKEG